MADSAVTKTLSGILTSDPERIFNDLAENVAALVGVAVSIQPLASDAGTLGPIFGNKSVYLFPIEDQSGSAISALVAMDIPGAACTGGALIMMPADAIKQVLQTQKVPEMLHDSVGEVANIIVGAMQQVIGKDLGGTADLRRGASFRQIKPGKWPALLHEIDKSGEWAAAAGKILFEQDEKGTILLACVGAAASDAGTASSTKVTGGHAAVPDAAPAAGTTTASPEAQHAAHGPLGAGDLSAVAAGLKVQVAGFPADSAAVALRSTLEHFGVRTLAMHAGLSTHQPDVMFVVSRSHIDLKLRLGAISASGRRPTLLIACSDRPTREIVMAARQESADDFLVLPADLERLRAILSRAPAAV